MAPPAHLCTDVLDFFWPASCKQQKHRVSALAEVECTALLRLCATPLDLQA